MVGGSRVVATGSQAVTMLVMARGLGPTSFAVFAATLGTLMALMLIADGGASVAVGRHHESDDTIAEILGSNRLLTLGVLVISLPTLCLLAVTTESAVLAACIPLTIWAPLERQLEVVSAYAIAKGRQRLVGLTYFLRRVPTLAAVLVFSAGSAVVWAYSISLLATAIIARVMLTRFITATGLRWSPRLFPDRGTWATLAPFWATVAGQGIRLMDVAVLTFAAGTTVSGIFAPASRLAPALLLVPWTYTQILLPRLVTTGERLSYKTIGLVGAFSAAFLAPLALTAQWWVPLLLGDAYTPSVPTVRIIVLSLVFAAMASAVSGGLNAADAAAHVARIVWFSSIVALALIATSGALYGAVGAAWAVAFGYLLQFLLLAAAYHFKSEPAPALNT